MNEGQPIETAFVNAVDYCIEHDILTGFLKENRAWELPQETVKKPENTVPGDRPRWAVTGPNGTQWHVDKRIQRC